MTVEKELVCECGDLESHHIDGCEMCVVPGCGCKEFSEPVEEEEVCEFCGGTGEISSMEYVYAGEPHMADIGTKTCICRIKNEDDFDDQQ